MISDLIIGKSKETIINLLKDKNIKDVLNDATSRDKEFIIEYIKEFRMDDVTEYLNNVGQHVNHYYKLKILSKIGVLEIFKKEFEKIYIDSEIFENSYEIELSSTMDYFNQAVKFKHYELIKYLLGYEIVGGYIINNHAWLNLATEYGDLKLVKILFEYYKDDERKIYEATYNAYKYNKPEILKILLPYAKLDKNDEEKFKSIL